VKTDSTAWELRHCGVRWSRCVFCCALLLAFSARAETASQCLDASEGESPLAVHQLLSKKLLLVQKLVETLPQPVPDAEALAERARAAWEAGRCEEAEDYVADALDTMRMARRMMETEQHREQRLKADVDALLDSANSYMDTLIRIAEEKGVQALGVVDTPSLRSELQQARELASQGDLPAARSNLATLNRRLEKALVAARENETLVYELDLSDPEVAFQYEMQTNQSYMMLLDLLSSERQLSATAEAYVSRTVAENASVREKAASLAEGGEFVQAVAVLESASKKLIQALKISGVPVQ